MTKLRRLQYVHNEPIALHSGISEVGNPGEDTNHPDPDKISAELIKAKCNTLKS
jgi:hypothetical protein